jgi:anaerobic magnesium-protoporphyrin IX monomethyl ester cyclase
MKCFYLNRKYYVPLCELLKDRGYGEFLRMWAYSRVDTVRRPDLLKLVREAGIKWLALGIESGDKTVRLEVSKGKFEDVDITQVINQVHETDIEVMANYIFGLPGDTKESNASNLGIYLKIYVPSDGMLMLLWPSQEVNYIKMLL